MKCPDCNGERKETCSNCFGIGTVTQMCFTSMIIFGAPGITSQIFYVCGGTGKVNCKRCCGIGEVSDK